MAKHSRHLFMSDEEMGKKDDDHSKRRASFSLKRRLCATSRWFALRRRRVAVTVLALVCIYLFVRHLPPAMGPPPNRFSPIAQAQSQASLAGLMPGDDRAPAGASCSSASDKKSLVDSKSAKKGKHISDGSGSGDAAMDGSGDEGYAHTYGGPIKFYSLGKSLRAMRQSQKSQKSLETILFAAASSKALSDLLPLACSMAEEQKTVGVHLAVMGREQVSMEGIQQVNSWDASACPITWHDARPDYGPWSTDRRMLDSTRAALIHLYNNVNQTTVITHDKTQDEPFFANGIREEAEELGITHIALPGQSLDFTWLSKLNAQSLQAFNDPHVEILIQASPLTSGSLIRLLKDLERANYFGPIPSLTIELPHKVDPFLTKYLSRMQWPPNSGAQMFTVRRRIVPHEVSPEEAAIRFVDAIQPKDPGNSHILVLSPQTVLSPAFYHYLKYAILHYKYSGDAEATLEHLMGISLYTPPTWPDTGEPFVPPEAVSADGKGTEHKDFIPNFLWQVPDGSAALYFGDWWLQLQSFVHNRHVVSARSESKIKDAAMFTPVLSKKYPAWLDNTLEFMRARGYFMLYPSFKQGDGFALAAVHRELWRAPEEYAGQEDDRKPPSDKSKAHDGSNDDDKEKDKSKNRKRSPTQDKSGSQRGRRKDQQKDTKQPATDKQSSKHDEALLTADVDADKAKNKKKEEGSELIDSKDQGIMQSSVLNDIFQVYSAGLPSLSQLTIYPHTLNDVDGEKDLNARAEKYAREFASRYGGCDAGEETGISTSWTSANDLFCLRDDEFDEENA